MRTATVHAIQKWEYEAITKKTEAYLAKELNELGQLGWELVCAMQYKDRKGELAWTAFVKRPYVPHPPSPPRAESPEENADASDSTVSGETSTKGFDLSGDEFSIRE
jgi:hypothetical protein